MKQANFLNDKFTPATLPDICAPRRRLISEFNKASSRRLIHVSAPAGFGKTVSTLLWLSGSKRKTAWISLDVYDNIPSIFYKLLCTGIVSIQPDNDSMKRILSSPSFSSSPVEHTINLLIEFIQSDMLYALAFDDMHVITNEEIIKSLPFVLKRLPHSFVTLLLSRNDPMGGGLALAEGENAAVITTNELMFTNNEILKYYDSLGLHLTIDEADSIFNITGGWAIGVNALAKSNRLDLESFGDQILDNYIQKHLWDNWDDDLKDFMIQTSIVDDIDIELSRRLTGWENAGEILNNLCAKNSFISYIGNDTYQYHHLFLDFLRARIHSMDIPVKRLHLLAARYYIETRHADSRNIYKARQHAIESDDQETIMQVAYKLHKYRNIPIDEYVNSTKIFSREILPESICNQYPFLYKIHIWYFYVCGDVNKMEYYFDKLYPYLPVIAKDFPQFFETCLMIKCLDHRIPLSDYLDQLDSILNHLPDANAHDTVQGHYLTLQMPFIHRGGRDFYEFSDFKLLERFKRSFNIFLQDKTEIALACMTAGILLEQNKRIEALEKILYAKELITENTFPEIIFSINICHATTLYSTGDIKKAAEVLQLTEEYIEESGAHYLRPGFLAYKTKKMLMNGDKAAASAWLNNYFVNETSTMELYKVFQHFTTARAYMALAQIDKARNYISGIKKLSIDFHRLLDIAEADVLQAILDWSLGYKKEAQNTLESLLEELQPYGFIHVIACEGAAVLPILKKIIAKHIKNDYHGSLDKKYLNNVYMSAYMQSKTRKGLVVGESNRLVKLSKRQKLMIELLSLGYKNSDIIKETGLTINTVKSHTRIAYEKLTVNNAADAVLKARELGIIK